MHKTEYRQTKRHRDKYNKSHQKTAFLVLQLWKKNVLGDCLLLSTYSTYSTAPLSLTY